MTCNLSADVVAAVHQERDQWTSHLLIRVHGCWLYGCYASKGSAQSIAGLVRGVYGVRLVKSVNTACVVFTEADHDSIW
jgi:hypothetical protein